MNRPKLAAFIIPTGVAFLAVAASAPIALADPAAPSEVADWGGTVVTTRILADNDPADDSLSTEAVTSVLSLDPLEGIILGSDLPGGLTEPIVSDDPIGGMLPESPLVPTLPLPDRPTDGLPPVNVPEISSPGERPPADNPGVPVQPPAPSGNTAPASSQGPTIAHSETKATQEKVQKTSFARRLSNAPRAERDVQGPPGVNANGLPGSSETAPSGNGPLHRLSAVLSGDRLFTTSALRDSLLAVAMVAPIPLALWLWLRQQRPEKGLSPPFPTDPYRSEGELPLASRIVMKVIADLSRPFSRDDRDDDA